MRNRLSAHRAFTLIELLVVIAIICLLSSIVLASLNTARLKARDAAILSELNQLVALVELEYNENRSYVGLQRNQWSTGTACSVMFTGNYAVNARNICASITAKQGVTGSVFYSGVNPTAARGGNPGAYTKYYSFMARLPGETARTGVATYACVGSSGARYIGPQTPSGGTSWSGAGCYDNP
jgi:prepilin-type N-terminal cleavage/methylation domain-containing protein